MQLLGEIGGDAGAAAGEVEDAPRREGGLVDLAGEVDLEGGAVVEGVAEPGEGVAAVSARGARVLAGEHPRLPGRAEQQIKPPPMTSTSLPRKRSSGFCEHWMLPSGPLRAGP
ncbi:hypothetical protein [Actinacidiphila oryziradicis]|uniref:Uncharacterized protein n=1 Tax=Actinacidiphila oryziradicis TaxID=2571141 RepID=A0A4U0RND1_9ACTN|nr:hypothetical protein [Actinacidiphila oryziradicis]TJZ96837.1 hypothetical protein FCI23_50385 [Actinacidiphila oryziradicis]